jgi:hypothetical protein
LKRVCILRDWHNFDVFRQTPGKKGVWEDILFSEVVEPKSDYTIVLNRPLVDVIVHSPPQNVWAIIQEPPNEIFSRLHKGDSSFFRVYTSDETLQGDRYFHSQPAIAWHVDYDYDELSRCGIPEKKLDLSWITTNKMVFRGHRARMKFLRKIQDELEFDLFGYGIRPIDNKWNGLAPYRYSLAIENHTNPYYWSEKIADCFLAWTMPIYYGCTRISDYFPPESMISIDIGDPDGAALIREAIQKNHWERNLDAIAHSRQLVLNHYQLFPFITKEIHDYEQEGFPQVLDDQPVFIPHEFRQEYSLKERSRDLWRKFIPRRLRRNLAAIRHRFE